MLNNSDKIMALYANSGWKKIFGRLRFWYAPFKEVEALLPKSGIIVDLGCGEGFLANYIALSSPQRQVIGIELDKNRIKLASHGIQNAVFKQGDITTASLPSSCSAIIIFHVLHHLPSLKAQDTVIQLCRNSLKNGGKLIIIEIHKKTTLHYFLTWFTDNFLVAWFFEKKFRTQIFFRQRQEWENLLQSYEFSVSTKYGERLKPFSNVIFECIKKDS